MKENKLPNKWDNFRRVLIPFFNLKIGDWEDVVGLILGASLMVIVLFQGYFMELNYDEAYTYLNTGRFDNVWQIYQFRIANTHFLNSLLMSVSTLFFPFNDIAIRLPAMLFGGFYITTAISLSKQYKNKLLLLSLLFFFYFFTMYMSMARGYVISGACVLAMIFVYKNQDQFKNWFMTFSVFALLAMYGNYVAIPIVMVFGAYIYILDLNFSSPPVSKKQLGTLIIVFLIGLWGFYSVTQVGKPLYGAFEETFVEAIPLDWLARFVGGYSMSSHNIASQYSYLELIAGPLFFLLAIGVVLTYLFGGKRNVVGVVTMATLLLIFIISELGSKPLPTGRVLIPFWPLIVVTIIEVIEFVTERLKINELVIKLMNVALVVVIIINYSGHFYSDWSKELSKVAEFRVLNPFRNFESGLSPVDVYYDAYDENYEEMQIRPENLYYILKERREKNLISYLQQFQPTETRKENGFEFKVYSSAQLITMQFVKTPKNQSFERFFISGSDTVYSDTFRVDSNLFKSGFSLPLVFVYPENSKAKKLVIKSKDGLVNQAFEIAVP